MHTSVHKVFPHSELIHSCYSNIKVIKHAVSGKTGRQIWVQRKREIMAQVWLECDSWIFFFIIFSGTVCGHCCMFSVYRTVGFVLLLQITAIQTTSTFIDLHCHLFELLLPPNKVLNRSKTADLQVVHAKLHWENSLMQMGIEKIIK